MAETDVFKHSTPALYDRYMGPLLFEPYARHVAEGVAAWRPERILETAAGTGIVTRAVQLAVSEATFVATDINPAVVEFAAQRETSSGSPFSRQTRRMCHSRTRASTSCSACSESCSFPTRFARMPRLAGFFGREAAMSW